MPHAPPLPKGRLESWEKLGNAMAGVCSTGVHHAARFPYAVRSTGLFLCLERSLEITRLPLHPRIFLV